MKNHIFIVALVALVPALLYATPHTTHADEIHYGSLKDQHADTLFLEYKSPGGATHYTCTTDGDCDTTKAETLNTFPRVLGSYVYEKSADGRLAVKPFVFGSMVYHFLYDISGEKAKKLKLIPYIKTGAKVRFTSNNDAVIFERGNTFTHYDIASRKLSSVTLPQKLSFLSISPSGNYISGYNYGTLRHEVWRMKDRVKLNGPSAMQSYFEFSEDETRVAFLDDVKGFRTLFTMHVSDLGKSKPTSLIQLTKPKTETEDYLFIEDTLYFMANVDGPLEWDLFNYDGDIERVASDVSYGDYLKRVGTDDGSLLTYLKTDGKNTNIHLTAPDEKDVELAPTKESPVSSEVIRTVKSYGGPTGVLWSPEDPARRPALFVWMHGGPQRQVAKGYHPYLSYAVYDEMLERLVEGGHYVYKIDYTGSSGYGANFRKALHMKIGDIEMDDIHDAIEDIEDDIDINKVYLIGNSYGGYMALRGIVDMPKDVDGVVSINGVSDWYGLIQKIPSSPFKALFNGVPDTHNLDAYFQASVFTGMEDLSSRDKVLVVWGENDSTVPVWQSEHYVKFAEDQDVNVDTLSFDDEDHILRKRENLDSLCNKITSFLRIRGVSCKL